MGKKTQQNFLYIDFTQVQCKIQITRLDGFLCSKWNFSSHNYLIYVCVQMSEVPPLFILIRNPNNSIGPNYPPNQGRLALGDSKLHFSNTFVGTTDPNYNKDFTSILYMTNYINDIPNRRNNIPERVITIMIQIIIYSTITFL